MGKTSNPGKMSFTLQVICILYLGSRQAYNSVMRCPSPYQHFLSLQRQNFEIINNEAFPCQILFFRSWPKCSLVELLMMVIFFFPRTLGKFQKTDQKILTCYYLERLNKQLQNCQPDIFLGQNNSMADISKGFKG